MDERNLINLDERTFYFVESRYNDGGRVDVSEVFEMISDRKPEKFGGTGAFCDVYLDFFDTREEAEIFAAECRFNMTDD